MFDEALIASSKMISLLIFFPIFAGAVVYAYWPGNRAALDAQARIPFDEGA